MKKGSDLEPQAQLTPRSAGKSAQPPIELSGRQGRRPKTAAGFGAIMESANFGIRRAGVKNSLKTFGKLNQVHGFICQSCAWPNPDDDRSMAEFCENGFKAVSYEVDARLFESLSRVHKRRAASHDRNWQGLCEAAGRRNG